MLLRWSKIKSGGLKIKLDVPFLVRVFRIVHILYCTNTLHLPLIIQHLTIASEAKSISFVGLFCRLEKGIILYSEAKTYHCIIFFSQFQPQVYSQNILKILQISTSIFL